MRFALICFMLLVVSATLLALQVAYAPSKKPMKKWAELGCYDGHVIMHLNGKWIRTNEKCGEHSK